MIGSTYVILTCLAVCCTLCLAKPSEEAPKRSMNGTRGHDAGATEGDGAIQSSAEFWGHSSGFTIGIDWKSNARLADNSDHHYAFGPIARESTQSIQPSRVASPAKFAQRMASKRSERKGLACVATTTAA